MAAPTTHVEPFVCQECERLSQRRNTPPQETAHPDCSRCGEPTRQYVGAVKQGIAVVVSASSFVELAARGDQIPTTPGVRVIDGIEFYSAAWL